MKILAYDFGTGGIKAALFDGEGRLVDSAFVGYSTFYPQSGHHEQSPRDWWRAVVESTRRLTAEKGDVVAIGISGHSLGVVPIDRDGRLLRERVPIWSDSRASEEPAGFFRALGKSEEDWYLATGCGFPPALYSVFKMMWFKRHESAWFDRAEVILGTKDYINFLLTGVCATDNSYASGSGVYDLRRRAYCEEFIAASGLRRSLFAKIVPSTEVLGEVKGEVAAELGLPRGVKVVAGGVDNSCMALGAGAYREGRAYNSLGSSAWIALSSEEPVLDASSRPYVFDHVVPNQYASALAIFSAGTSHNWFRQILGVDFAEFDRLAEAAGPLAHGLFFNPTLAGGSSLDPTPDLRGAFVNIDLKHTRADMARAVLEGVAFGLKTALDGLAAARPICEPLVLVGGGAKSALWRQIFADVYALGVSRSSIGQQCAALGAATVAGVGAGVWDGFSVVDRVAEAGDDVTLPNGATISAYATACENYRRLTQSLGAWTLDKRQSSP